MSYAFDVLQRAVSRPPARSSRAHFCLELLVAEMHEANHRLHDGINTDPRVSEAARDLDEALQEATSS